MPFFYFIFRFLKITKKDAVKLAATRIGHDDFPLQKKVPYEQLKPVKISTLHKNSAELVSDSSTDTDVKLYQREELITSPAEAMASSHPDTNIICDQDSVEHQEKEDDTIFISYQPKATREAKCLSPVSASLQCTEIKAMIDILNRKLWLTDDHLNHCQALLKHQFPQVDGLQS